MSKQKTTKNLPTLTTVRKTKLARIKEEIKYFIIRHADDVIPEQLLNGVKLRDQYTVAHMISRKQFGVLKVYFSSKVLIVGDENRYVLDRIFMSVLRQLTKGMSKKEYLKRAGNLCPYCWSAMVNGRDVETDGSIAWRACICAVCHKSWQDIYRLISFEPMKS